MNTTSASATWTVAVLGPGGIGGLVGGLLARAGHRVICLAREETAAVLNERGLSIRSDTFGEFTAPVTAATELREPVDAVVLAPKETDLAAALDRLPTAVLGKGLVLPLLNGFEHVDMVRERYPAEQVVPGTIRAESTRTAPGVIAHTTPFAVVEVASSTAPPERVAELAGVLGGAGFQVNVRADEAAMLWGKLSFLLPMALLTTRYAITVGQVRTERRDEMLAVIGEFDRVAAAAGAPVDTERLLQVIDGMPHGTKSSMQRDAEAGRPLETDAIGGAVLRAARRAGIETPVIGRLVGEVTAGAGAWGTLPPPPSTSSPSGD